MFGNPGTRRGLAILVLSSIAVVSSGCLRFGWDRLSRKVPSEVVDTLQRESMEADLTQLRNIGGGQRTPFTQGEQNTLKYLVRRFHQIGLQPAGSDGFLQAVEVDAISLRDAKLKVAGRSLRPGDELAIWSQRPRKLVEAAAQEIVFVGYGITAPERGRDDYRGLDLHGRCALVLMGDPAFAETEAAASPQRPETLEPAGRDSLGASSKGMTGLGGSTSWYAQWQYKVEEAARHGALGVLLVHDPRGTGLSWAKWRERLGGFRIQRHWDKADSLEAPPLDFVGAVSSSIGDAVLRAAAIQPRLAKKAARDPRFLGRVLSVPIRVSVENEIRRTRSFNVVGEIPGRYDAEQSVVIAAEWDQGDENARTCSGLLALATAFRSLPQAPARTVEFVAATLSTRGHLGTQEFTHHPHRRLDNTAAAFILDHGDSSCVRYSELQKVLQEAAREDHRILERNTDLRCWIASATLAFAQAGVPAASVPCEVDDLKTVLRAAYRLAQSKGGPRWSAESPFRYYPR